MTHSCKQKVNKDKRCECDINDRQTFDVIQVLRVQVDAMNFVEEFSTDEKLKIAGEFARLKNCNYLDNAGAALYAESQIEQISEVLTTSCFFNPHTSKSSENIVDQVRFR